MYLLVFFFALGACVGSFVNVAVLRFGFTERASPRSRCMACETALPWFDLFPVFSFALLKGRCRACGSGLSAQYPLVELTVAALFAFAYAVMPPLISFWPLVAFIALLVFLAAFVGVVAYDLRHTLVPMPFVWIMASAAFVAAAAQSFFAASSAPLFDAVSGGATLFVFFILIVLITRGKGMGSGDAYLAGTIGLLLGFTRGIEATMLGVWAGTLFGLVLLFLSSLSVSKRLFGVRLHVTMKTEVPLAPFLAFGTVLALFTGISPLAAAASFTSFFFPHL